MKKYDTVIYTSGSHGESKNNPLWGGVFHGITGIITKINPYREPTIVDPTVPLNIEVRWGNGTVNSYNARDLTLFKVSLNTAKQAKEIVRLFEQE